MGDQTKLVREGDLRGVIVKALCRAGLGREDAGTVADVLTEAELRGRPTHGIMRLPGLVKMAGELTDERPRLVTDHGPAACIDAAHHLGYVACGMAVSEAVERAGKYDLAMVGVRRSRHTGMLGYYVWRMAQEGLVALGASHCCPLVAPWGGAEKVLGTNPIAAAFPREPHPILIDMGTSAITAGAVGLALDGGRPLPESAALDAEGSPTTDPAAAQAGALLPMAGHKGYALALLVQLLAGPFTGSEGVPWRRDEYGTVFIAARKGALAAGTDVERETEELVRAVKSARRMEGVEEILLPGDRAFRERERRLREGVPVVASFWRKACELAGVGAAGA